MKCIKCNREIPEESIFCMYCGKKVGENPENENEKKKMADVPF